MDIETRQKLLQNIDSEDIPVLDSLYDIEDIALEIKELSHKIDIQKGYKANRIQAINNEIKGLEGKIDFLKKIILATMNNNGEKNINFPESCKISLRKNNPKWVIDDDEQLIVELKRRGDDDGCVEEVVSYKIKKRELDKVLKDWEKADKIPEDIVHKEEIGQSVSISFAETEKDFTSAEDVPIPVKKDNLNDDQYDGLTGF